MAKGTPKRQSMKSIRAWGVLDWTRSTLAHGWDDGKLRAWIFRTKREASSYKPYLPDVTGKRCRIVRIEIRERARSAREGQ
jgi:hypothetical protein